MSEDEVDLVELRYTAYHEASHAVMAWYCGNVVGEVTAEPDHDAGTAGRFLQRSTGLLGGDLGLHFQFDPEDGLVVEEPDGWRRLPTAAEREHKELADEFDAIPYLQRMLLVCAAGEAALALVPEYPGEAGSGQDLADALEIDPDMAWEEWVSRARDFLLRPVIRRRVEALAEALMNRRTIAGAEALRIIREAM